MKMEMVSDQGGEGRIRCGFLGFFLMMVMVNGWSMGEIGSRFHGRHHDCSCYRLLYDRC